MKKDAVIKGKYRYSLIREWDATKDRKAVFIMLNPSTADGENDDATTKKCITFAKCWNCGSLEIVNVFAYRATKPKELRSLTKEEATGGENIEYIKAALSRATIKVAAWGENITYHLKKYSELEEIFNGHRILCLGTSRDGHPRHPLYLKSSTPLEVYYF